MQVLIFGEPWSSSNESKNLTLEALNYFAVGTGYAASITVGHSSTLASGLPDILGTC